MKIKMSDVAKAAGVSLATVGRVLHNNGYVSEAKRKEIEQIIKETGYIPNKIAQGLKKSRSKIIGHLTLFNNNMQFKEISSAINMAASNSGYHVLTMTSHYGMGDEEQQLNDLIGHRVDGIIITSYHSISMELIGRLIEQNIPVVMIERTYEIPMVDRIVVNDHAISLNAVRHIVHKGHRRIAFIGAALEHQVETDRFTGYIDALNEAGIVPHEEWVNVMSEYSVEEGRKAIGILLNAKQPPTAIFMTSDIYACGVMQILYERGLRVPDDLSLIGYDNTLSALLSPPITSVGLPFKEIGEHALDLLIRRMNDNSALSRTIRIDPFLMDRHTVRNWHSE
ncbi:LacI family DNA-binding transcriptional regulator [Paenibacillus sinopodophylli]|uniref:LacI family DNA-binding transcriptional regulator n=1 Tax=Paenibacillus sinopodophylli TaxID=1837342 RepID=UPI00110CD268|nr:LacI family DNA-binding transcriptional regulator [Paenibacillus sinopodophylli]